MTQGQLLTFKPSSVVEDHITSLGRTEDVVFSPDQTRLAIAGFNESKVLVIQIKIASENGALTVHSEECVELLCEDFQRPHGLSWIDDSTLVCANRGGDVIIIPVPAVSSADTSVEVSPLLRLSNGSEGILGSPGSVAVTRLNDKYFDILVCNNYRHYVSRHIIEKKNGFSVVAALRLFEHGLRVPDSISVSSDSALVAVSNHDGRSVDVFSNSLDSNRSSRPDFSLGISHYPHGLRFAMDDRLLLVADAGAPCVHVFAREGTTWKASKSPSLSITVMDEDSFQRGNVNPQEGGPKGLDILSDGSVVAVSCEEMPIAFFDFRQVRDQLLLNSSTSEQKTRSDNVRLVDTIMATMMGQHAEIEALKAENRDYRMVRDRSLDRRLDRFVKRLGLKILGWSGRT